MNTGLALINSSRETRDSTPIRLDAIKEARPWLARGRGVAGAGVMRRTLQLLILLAHAVFFAGCLTTSHTKSAPAGSAAETPGPGESQASEQVKETKTGVALFLGEDFHSKRTASGEPFDKNALVAAHPSYPLGTIVRVTNLKNEQAVEVRIIDRGPSVKHQKEGVVIDLSHVDAERHNFIKEGRARVRLEVLAWGGEPQR
jgi:rare lipoprotein A